MGKTGTIYKIENLINGKVYIGQTIQDFKVRKDSHLYELENGVKVNAKFQNAWNKYGKENFEFNIIGSYPVSELDKREVEFIKKYDSYRNGYNATTGGQKNFRHSHNDTTRIKLSIRGKEIWRNKEFRKKMMERPVYSGNEAPRAIKVICINDQKVFGCMVEAGEYYGITKNQVSECCLGNTAYTGLNETGRKLEFAYYEESKNYQLKNTVHCNEKIKVICLTTGETFNSAREGAKKYNTNVSGILRNCRGERQSSGKLDNGTKLRWRYA